jgi:hypothetical protein
MSKPLEPRLPRWGHISVSAKARRNLRFGKRWVHSADEALTYICDCLREVGDETPDATVTIRPPGLSIGEPADRVVEGIPCDTSFGVPDDLKNCIRVKLGSGSKAPSLKLVFRFDKTTH